MEFTEAQVTRQMLRIRASIFDNFEVLEDNPDAYKGELKPDFKKIIELHVKLDKVMSEDQFKTMFSECVADMTEWIMKNTDGVDQPVVNVFCIDLLEQTLSRIYSVEEVNEPSNDYMYG
jgi:arginyl-tRNA--protein-N-Asp/Glu arginylyltransferase